jgi:hypothetical protein
VPAELLREVRSRYAENGKIRADQLAGELGFEPRLTESESAVLPLNYSPPTAQMAANVEFFNMDKSDIWVKSGTRDCQKPAMLTAISLVMALLLLRLDRMMKSEPGALAVDCRWNCIASWTNKKWLEAERHSSPRHCDDLRRLAAFLPTRI